MKEIPVTLEYDQKNIIGKLIITEEIFNKIKEYHKENLFPIFSIAMSEDKLYGLGLFFKCKNND